MFLRHHKSVPRLLQLAPYPFLTIFILVFFCSLVKMSSAPPPLRIFGFGSIIYHPGFRYNRARLGYVDGWRRVFYQASVEHRGTYESPGRTATLEQDPNSKVYGVLFEMFPHSQQELDNVIEYLRWREQKYDLCQRVSVKGLRKYDDAPVLVDDSVKSCSQNTSVHGDIHKGVQMIIQALADSKETEDVPVEAITWIATSNKVTNPLYLGPGKGRQEIAQIIAESKGPSGRNYVYLLRLTKILTQLGITQEMDDETFWLEKEVVRILKERGETVDLDESQNHSAKAWNKN